MFSILLENKYKSHSFARQRIVFVQPIFSLFGLVFGTDIFVCFFFVVVLEFLWLGSNNNSCVLFIEAPNNFEAKPK